MSFDDHRQVGLCEIPRFERPLCSLFALIFGVGFRTIFRRTEGHSRSAFTCNRPQFFERDRFRRRAITLVELAKRIDIRFVDWTNHRPLLAKRPPKQVSPRRSPGDEGLLSMLDHERQLLGSVIFLKPS